LESYGISPLGAKHDPEKLGPLSNFVSKRTASLPRVDQRRFQSVVGKVIRGVGHERHRSRHGFL
jgi:hypothetical protein